ncbi:MAG: 4'-phosphopantetheinyl transferase superfamily protein [Lachnospiraceae bacterium]|nr:4'-phosphopantetheinyl transferase superfamily protein [Lachnospiraceae bacterium]
MRVDFYIIKADRPDVVSRSGDPEGFSDYRRKKITALKNPASKRLSTAAGMAVENGLKKFGLRENDVSYGLNEHGKPFVEGHPEIVFNVSHSGDYAVAAFVDTEEADAVFVGTEEADRGGSDNGKDLPPKVLWSVGVDIERIDRMNRRIVSKMKKDVGFDNPSDADEQEKDMTDLCRRWTSAEAFVKCIGTGLISLEEDFHFEKTPSGYIRLCQDIYDGEFSLIEADAPSGYCITCVVRKQEIKRRKIKK